MDGGSRPLPACGGASTIRTSRTSSAWPLPARGRRPAPPRRPHRRAPAVRPARGSALPAHDQSAGGRGRSRRGRSPSHVRRSRHRVRRGGGRVLRGRGAPVLSAVSRRPRAARLLPSGHARSRGLAGVAGRRFACGRPRCDLGAGFVRRPRRRVGGRGAVPAQTVHFRGSARQAAQLRAVSRERRGGSGEWAGRHRPPDRDAARTGRAAVAQGDERGHSGRGRDRAGRDRARDVRRRGGRADRRHPGHGAPLSGSTSRITAWRDGARTMVLWADRRCGYERVPRP